MHKQSLFRFLAFSGVLALTACGGGGGGGLFGPLTTAQCDPGTQVQLASPLPNAAAVSANQGAITIVANGNANSLYNTYSNWNLVLTDNAGDQPIFTQNLSLVPFNSGPHPYASDFYYQAPLPTLRSGVTYSVSLQQNQGSTCTAVPLQSFST